MGGVLSTVGIWGTVTCESSVVKDVALGLFFAMEEIITPQYDHKSANFFLVAMGAAAFTGTLSLGLDKLRSCSIVGLQKLKDLEPKVKKISKALENSPKTVQHYLNYLSQPAPRRRQFKRVEIREPLEMKRESSEMKTEMEFKEVRFNVDIEGLMYDVLEGIRDVVSGTLVLCIPYVMIDKTINGSVSLLSLVGVEGAEELTVSQPSSIAIGIGCLLGNVLAGTISRKELDSREVLKSSARFIGHTSIEILKLSAKGIGYGYHESCRLFNIVKRNLIIANDYVPYRFG